MNSPVELTHYALLRVERDAGVKEIEAAYVAAMQRQPRSRLLRTVMWFFTGESEESLRIARDTLCDPQARTKYDEELARAPFYWAPPG